jgi:hypothetical protein
VEVAAGPVRSAPPGQRSRAPRRGRPAWPSTARPSRPRRRPPAGPPARRRPARHRPRPGRPVQQLADLPASRRRPGRLCAQSGRLPAGHVPRPGAGDHTAADPVLSIALGIVWLDVRVRSSPAAIAGEVASLLLMIVGIVITSQHAPQVTGPAEAMPIGQQRGAGERLRRLSALLCGIHARRNRMPNPAALTFFSPVQRMLHLRWQAWSPPMAACGVRRGGRLSIPADRWWPRARGPSGPGTPLLS